MMELVQRIAAFFDILSTRNVLIEIAAVALCLLAGWFVGAALRDRYQRRKIKAPDGLDAGPISRSQGIVVAAPAMVALGLVLVARSGLNAAHFDVTMLDAAAHLIGAYVVVRVGVLLFAASLGNKSWMQHWEIARHAGSSGWPSPPSTWAGSIPSSAPWTASAWRPARAASPCGRC